MNFYSTTRGQRRDYRCLKLVQVAIKEIVHLICESGKRKDTNEFPFRL